MNKSLRTLYFPKFTTMQKIMYIIKLLDKKHLADPNEEGTDEDDIVPAKGDLTQDQQPFVRTLVPFLFSIISEFVISNESQCIVELLSRTEKFLERFTIEHLMLTESQLKDVNLPLLDPRKTHKKLNAFFGQLFILNSANAEELKKQQKLIAWVQLFLFEFDQIFAPSLTRPTLLPHLYKNAWLILFQLQLQTETIYQIATQRMEETEDYLQRNIFGNPLAQLYKQPRKEKNTSRDDIFNDEQVDSHEESKDDQRNIKGPEIIHRFNDQAEIQKLFQDGEVLTFYIADLGYMIEGEIPKLSGEASEKKDFVTANF
eukprot:403344899